MLFPLTKIPQIRHNVNQSMGPTMYDQVNLTRARLNPASRFKRPMDVVKALGISSDEKFSILAAWEADERAVGPPAAVPREPTDQASR